MAAYGHRKERLKHTHYDGQATWDKHLTPSSNLGTTTVVRGNCGVGFAPCRPQDRDVLAQLMEGVEEIPGTDPGGGLSRDWESFPDFLDEQDRKPRDIDVAALLLLMATSPRKDSTPLTSNISPLRMIRSQ
jgi:N-acyl-D-aspartate/D-glutamate deacylase